MKGTGRANAEAMVSKMQCVKKGGIYIEWQEITDWLFRRWPLGT